MHDGWPVPCPLCTDCTWSLGRGGGCGQLEGGGGGSLQHEDVRISQNINRPHGQWRGCDESRAACLASVTRVTVTWPRDTESVMLSVVT